MTDTTTITPEERAQWKAEAKSEYVILVKDGHRLITALDALEAAEAEHAAIREDLETAEKNLAELHGFFRELCVGLKSRVPALYDDLAGDEYGNDAFSANDLLQIVVDPVLAESKDLYAENARLNKMVEWLARELWDFYPQKNIAELTEAARRAVAAGEG